VNLKTFQNSFDICLLVHTYDTLSFTLFFISIKEDNHCLVVLIISKLFTTISMSLTNMVRNIIHLVVLLTYTQWSSETIDKLNEVMTSWNPRYHDLKDCLNHIWAF